MNNPDQEARGPIGSGMRRYQIRSANLNMSIFGRALSIFLGLKLGIYASRRSTSFPGLLLGFSSVGLVVRGVKGYCPLHDYFQVDTSYEGKLLNKSWFDQHSYSLSKIVRLDIARSEAYGLLTDPNTFQAMVPGAERLEQIADGCHRVMIRKSSDQMFPIELVLSDLSKDEVLVWTLSVDDREQIKGHFRFSDGIDDSTLLAIRLEVFPPGGAIGAKIWENFGPIDHRFISQVAERLKQWLKSDPTSSIPEKGTGTYWDSKFFGMRSLAATRSS